MNVLTIVILLYLLLQALHGGRRGLFKSSFALVAVIAAMFFSTQCSTQVAKWIQDNTDIDENLQRQICRSLEQSSETSKADDGQAPENSTKNGDGESAEGEDNDSAEQWGRTWQQEQLARSGLPARIIQVLQANSNQEFFDALGADTFYLYIAGYMSGIIINAAAYILTFLALRLLFQIMGNALGVIFELPILRGFNRIGGALFGLVKGLLVLLVFFLLLTMFSSTSWGQLLMAQVESSPVLCYIYENNPLMEAVTDITKLIF